jgi:hypothetical protein
VLLIPGRYHLVTIGEVDDRLIVHVDAYVVNSKASEPAREGYPHPTGEAVGSDVTHCLTYLLSLALCLQHQSSRGVRQSRAQKRT